MIFHDKHKKFLAEVLAITTFLSVVFYGANFWHAQGASYTFTQTDWSGGLSTSTALHPTNQSGWNKYSTSTNITATSAIVMSQGGSSWFDTSWLNRRKITFTGATSTETLSNFPVQVSLNSSRINYNSTQNSGQDIRFTSSDGVTSLNYEIEKWDETGTSTVWVKVPSVTSTASYIYMYYNNTGAADAQAATSVWDSNFAGVWHLKESTGATSTDSTSNGNTGTPTGTSATSTGQIDGALSFNGSSYVRITDNAGLSPASTLTVSHWIRTPNVANVGFYWTAAKWHHQATRDNSWAIGPGSGGTGLRAFITSSPSDGGANLGNTATGLFSNNTWTHVVVVFNGSGATNADRLKIYVGGINRALTFTGTIPSALTNTVSDVRIGSAEGLGGTWIGDIDEFRVSSSTRSAAWIEGEYKNGVDTYSTYNTEEVIPYAASGNLVGSAYDSGSSANIIGQIAWDEDASLPSGTTVTFSIRTASSSAGLASASWSDFTNATANCSKTSGVVTCTSAAIPAAMKDGSNDQWFQYKVTLTSTGANTATADNVSIQYAANGPPDFNQSYGTGGVSSTQISSSGDTNWGKVPISYSVRDTDTNTGSTTPNLVTPSFDYNIGAGWNAITSGYLGATDLNNKTVEVSNYNTYTALWNAKGQIPGNYSASAQIRVNVNDNEAVNNTSSTTVTITLDTKNPTITSSTINMTQNAVILNFSDDTNIQYNLSNTSTPLSDSLFASDGVNTSGSWVSAGAASYTASTSWTFSGTYPTVYMGIRDSYNNTTTVTAVAPSTPASMYIKDTSNLSTGVYQEFLAWGLYTATTSATFARYEVMRSTDGTNYSPLTTISNVNTNFYTDSNSLSTSTTYYYKVRVVDTGGDISAYSSSVNDRPDGQGGTDGADPTISAVSVAETQATWMRITWTTDELANSLVGISVSPSVSFANQSASSTAYVTSHNITVTGLTPNTAYKFMVRSTDPAGNVTTNTNSGVGYSSSTTQGGTISAVTAESVSDNAATITWNTDVASNSYVVYSTAVATLDSGGGTSTGSSTAVSASSTGLYQHRVQITGLNQNTAYYYYVKSTDASSNLMTDKNGGSYYDFKTTTDASAPVITAVTAAAVTKNSAVITWLTDEPATSQIEYGTSQSVYPFNTTIDTSRSAFHVATITGLTNNTKYYYRARSKDAQNNEGISAENNLTTSDTNQIITTVTLRSGGGGGEVDVIPPKISNVKVDEVSAFGAAISFDTDESAVGYVLFGKDTAYSSATAASDSDFAKTHTVKLSQLSLNATYHFQARAQDKSGNFGESGDFTFTTRSVSESIEDAITLKNAGQFQERIENLIESVLPSLVPPFVGRVEVSRVSQNSATLKWRTNTPAYGLLAYSEERNYEEGKKYEKEVAETDFSASSGQAPSTGSGRAPSTGSGQAKRQDHEITLVNLSPKTTYHFQAKAYVLPGVIGKSKDQTFTTLASKIKPEIARLGNTEVEVRWITDEETSSFLEYKDISSGKGGQSGDQAKVKTHSVRLESLAPDANYEIRAFGYDKDNNLIEGDPLRIKTTRDSTPPNISNVKIDSALLPGRADRLQTVVSWKTDEPSNSIVKYDEGISIGGNLTKEAGQGGEYSTDHAVIITSFKPSTVYRVQVISSDESGNRAETSIRTILTPVSSESVLDIVTKNLEESFGFLKKLQF